MSASEIADLRDPRTAVAEALDCIAAAGSLVGAPDVAALADELLDYDRDERFEVAFDVVADAVYGNQTARADTVAFADQVCTDAQRTLLLQALATDDTDDHMALVGVVQTVRMGLEAGTDEALGAACAFAARLHDYATGDTKTLSRDLLREAALCEYTVYDSLGDPVDRHPDSVAPVQLHADMRVYGAVVVSDRYDLDLEEGAELAGERPSDFEETIAAYTGEAVQ